MKRLVCLAGEAAFVVAAAYGIMQCYANQAQPVGTLPVPVRDLSDHVWGTLSVARPPYEFKTSLGCLPKSLKPSPSSTYLAAMCVN